MVKEELWKTILVIRDLNFFLHVLFKKIMKFGWFLKTLYHFKTVLSSDIHPISFLVGSLSHFLISSKFKISSPKSGLNKDQFSSVAQSCPTLCNPMDCSMPGFPVHHQIWSLLKIMCIELVMPSNHLILCHPLPLLSSIFPSIRVFSNESVLCISWPKYWSFNFSISPSDGYSGLISFRIDNLGLLAVQGTLKGLLQHHSSKASMLRWSALFAK